MSLQAFATGRSILGGPFVITVTVAPGPDNVFIGANPDDPAWELGWRCYDLGIAQDKMRNETERQGWEAAQAHNQRTRRGYRSDAPNGAK